MIAVQTASISLRTAAKQQQYEPVIQGAKRYIMNASHCKATRTKEAVLRIPQYSCDDNSGARAKTNDFVQPCNMNAAVILLRERKRCGYVLQCMCTPPLG